MNLQKNIIIFLECCVIVADIKMKDFTNSKKYNPDKKYYIKIAIDLKFESYEIERYFKVTRSYISQIKKYNFLALGNQIKLTDLRTSVLDMYYKEMSAYQSIEKSINKKQKLEETIHRQILTIKDLLDDNTNLSNKNKELQRGLKKADEKKSFSDNLITIKKFVAEWQYKDNSPANAKLIMNKISEILFGDIPITDFERRKMFQKILKSMF